MNTVIVPSKFADLDGLASAYSYSKLSGNDYYFDKLKAEAEYCVQKFNLNKPPRKGWRSFIVVDSSSKYGLMDFLDREKVIEVIDHRESGLTNAKKEFPNAKIQIELVGACATLIFERMASEKFEIDDITANLLYLAIYSNTLNLRSTNTTVRDLKAIASLRKTNKIIKDIELEMFSYQKQQILTSPFDSIRTELKAGYLLGDDSLGISQLEIYGAEELIRSAEAITSFLKEFGKEKKLDLLFLNIPDMKNGVNYFIASNQRTRDLLTAELNVKFNSALVGKGKLLLRKQIEKLLNVSFA